MKDIVHCCWALPLGRLTLVSHWFLWHWAVWRSPGSIQWCQGRDLSRLVHSRNQLTPTCHLRGPQHLLCHFWLEIAQVVTWPQSGNLGREVLSWLGRFPGTALICNVLLCGQEGPDLRALCLRAVPRRPPWWLSAPRPSVLPGGACTAVWGLGLCWVWTTPVVYLEALALGTGGRLHLPSLDPGCWHFMYFYLLKKELLVGDGCHNVM